MSSKALIMKVFRSLPFVRKKEKLQPKGLKVLIPFLKKDEIRRLKNADLNDPYLIAKMSSHEISKLTGINKNRVILLYRILLNNLGYGFRSGDEGTKDGKHETEFITTGSKNLDKLLGGGVPTGMITEFFGEFRTGKTQIMHQLSVNVQLPRRLGGLEGRPIYIDTENNFRPKRIKQMAKALGTRVLEPKKALHEIIIGGAYNSDHQKFLTMDIDDIIKKKGDVKLIIVDSLMEHFRYEYIKKSTLNKRQEEIKDHLLLLKRLNRYYPDIAIVITNQVTTAIRSKNEGRQIAAGGTIVAHTPHTIISLKKGRGIVRIARVVNSSYLPEKEDEFVIIKEGIRD